MARRSLPSSEERRGLTLAAAGVEVRASDVEPTFVGHAAVFDVRAAIGNPLTWGFYEQIAPGAFTRTLNGAGSDARMLIDHNPAMVVSRGSAGTLRLSEDAAGLAVDSDLDTGLSYVGDLIANVRNGNITGMSFGFQVMRDDWAGEEIETNDGDPAKVEVRTIREVKLIEVSAVTFPAYEETDAGLRALAHRADRAAIERRLPHLPAVSKLLADIDRDSGESTRGDVVPDSAASTREHAISIADRMQALQARYPDLSRA